MAAIFNHNKFKPYKPTDTMELEYLKHNERLLLKQLAILQDKLKIYKKQLSETKKQIKKWKI
jgi:hypothetical protein